MCGRLTRDFTWAELHDLLDLRWPESTKITPSWNVAPTQTTPIVRLAPEGPHAGERELVEMKWGLVPFWAKDPAIGSRMINARGETVAEKPAFRAAFKSRRCIVPASGFYEWKKTGGASSSAGLFTGGSKKPAKQPYYITPADGKILAFAGLWESWDTGDGPLETFTIITTTPNAMMAELHDRMPVILDPECVGAWLNLELSKGDALALLRPAPDETLGCREVSTRVNSPVNNDASLLQPDQRGLFGA
jgi:putative SOS response-associated peptidase YedK